MARPLAVFLVCCALLAGSALASLSQQAQGDPDVKVVLKRESKPIPYPVVYEFSRTVGQGRVVKKRDGEDGKLIRTYAVTLSSGKPIAQVLLKEERIEPVEALFHMGRMGYPASRGSHTRSQVIEMEATAYEPSAGRGKRATYRTSTGLRAGYGIVAVDPTVIPYGTRLFVEGYGYAIAADTGSAIKGNRIDVCFQTRAEALEWGRRKVKVHIFRERP
ncbi:MAG: peptidoglycan-binding protein [Armatimonadetes bacterium]|nr:hypothetical protein [Fimbriimonadaceae bacterium]NOG39261.1 peptidoglycan-binding protein [Armatimonadota bacterium]GIK33245.1 MAG: hypothetical protein BroJett009_22370 [Armatimonadota bacterium]